MLMNREAVKAALTSLKQHMPTVKLGTDEEPLCYTFKDAEELTEFVKGMRQHIQDCLNASWQEREEIDWTVFV